MSRWSRDQLRIALAPHGVALVRHRGQSGKPLASKSLPCDTRDWQSLMPLLERELTDPAWRTPHVEVVLSNHYVRYVITPPPGKALNQREEAALVSASFREIYGAETADWRIRVHSQPPEYGLVGAAIDESLAARIEALFTHHADWKLRPLASLAAQHQATDWWVLAEPGWMCMFHTVNGYWRYLSARAVDDDWRSALPEMLDREARMSGSLPAPGLAQTALVQSVGMGSAPPPAASGWHWRTTKQPGLEHGALALAMA